MIYYVVHENLLKVREFHDFIKPNWCIDILDIIRNDTVIDKKTLSGNTLSIGLKKYKDCSLHISPYIFGNPDLNSFINKTLTVFKDVFISDFIYEKVLKNDKVILYTRNHKMFSRYTMDVWYWNQETNSLMDFKNEISN